MKNTLIAMVATAMMVEGVRTIIQPGQELPELSDHDARELTASGAAENPGDKAALAKEDRRIAATAEAQFAAARERIQQEQASTATETETAAETATGDPKPEPELKAKPEAKAKTVARK